MSREHELGRGTLVVHYRVEALLGRGGMSVVYLAEDLLLKRHVALKVLAPELAENADFRERFLAESRLAASLDHANVIPVYEAGDSDGSLFIAMRYVEGSDLKVQLADGPLSDAQAVAVLDQIGSALDAAHERGLVHGDVKPSNVLIDGRGHAYLADFGLTRLLTDERSPGDEPQVLGTIDYVAPEQIRGDQVDGRADLYSLGCLFYECLTGRQPFRRGNDAAVLYAHLEDDPPATGRPADPVIRRALAKDPADRYQSGGDLARAARAALGIAAPHRSRKPLVVAAAAIVVALAAVTAAVLLRHEGSGEPRGRLIRIDPRTNKLTKEVAVGAGPTGVAVAPGSIWVTSLADADVWRVDSASFSTATVPAQGSPIGVVTHGGTAYIVTTVAGPYGGGSGGQAEVTAVPTQGGRALHAIRTGSTLAVANAANGLWLTRQYDVVHVDLTSEIASTIDVRIPLRARPALAGIAVGAGSVWVLSDADGHTLWQLDPIRRRVERTIDLPFAPSAVAAARNAVWVTAQLDDEVARIDPATGRIAATIGVGREPLAVTTGPGAVWVANTVDRSISRIDPRTNRVTATIAIDRSPTALASGEGALWVATDAS